MKKLWALLSEPRNLAVLVAVGGGLGFVLKEFVLPRPASTPPATVVEQSAAANGGAAVNATGAAQVGVGVGVGAQAPAASTPAAAASQRAAASGGGVAVNASDSAQVSVHGPEAAASR